MAMKSRGLGNAVPDFTEARETDTLMMKTKPAATANSQKMVIIGGKLCDMNTIFIIS